MKKGVLIAAIVLLSFGLTACKEKITQLRLATGSTTGTYYSYGHVLAGILGNKLNLPITIQSTGASNANIHLIEDDAVELAIVQNDVMDYAWNGKELFAGQKFTRFSAIAALYPEVCHVIANPNSGIETVADLRGKRVSVGDPGSGTEFNARQVLECYGISFGDIEVHYLDFGASEDAFIDGRIDAFFVIAGFPTPVLSDLSSLSNMILLNIDDIHADILIRAYPYYSRLSIPAATYNGQETEVRTVAVKATLIANSKLSEDIIYRMTKYLFESKIELEEVHPKGYDLSRAYAVEGISVPFHPGALKYYREIGVIR